MRSPLPAIGAPAAEGTLDVVAAKYHPMNLKVFMTPLSTCKCGSKLTPEPYKAKKAEVITFNKKHLVPDYWESEFGISSCWIHEGPMRNKLKAII